MNRIIRFGNTEELLQFCPEEIVYIEVAEKGTEKSVAHMYNHSTYILPMGIDNVQKNIDDTLRPYKQTDTSTLLLKKTGRFFIINMDYIIKPIDAPDKIRLKFKEKEEFIKISKEAYKELVENINLTKEQQKKYNREHFKGGYKVKTLRSLSHPGSGSFGGGSFMSFITLSDNDDSVPRPESYYDISEDEIMFLGV